MNCILGIARSQQCLCALLLLLTRLRTSRATNHQLLVISLDGFRFDYSQLAHTPVLDRLRNRGATFDYMHPVFPTKTFPGHHSMATGLHPDSHGIVGNYMFDASTGKHFSPRRMNDALWWREGEPIWITAKRQGLKTGVCFWLGGQMEFGGLRADLVMPFNHSVSKHEQINTVATWLTRDRADLVLLYFNEPDHTAHSTGSASTSQETRDAVQHVDRLIGQLMRKLANAGLRDQLNILIVSDHGMTDVSLDDRVIELHDVISHHDVRDVTDEGALVNLLPHEGREDAVYEQLKQLQLKQPHMTVYKKQDLPEHLLFKTHPRIHPIVILADESWMVVWVSTESSNRKRKCDHL